MQTVNDVWMNKYAEKKKTKKYQLLHIFCSAAMNDALYGFIIMITFYMVSVQSKQLCKLSADNFYFCLSEM